MVIVDVDGSSLLLESKAKMVGLIRRMAAIWSSVCIHEINRVNSRNCLAMMTAP